MVHLRLKMKQKLRLRQPLAQISLPCGARHDLGLHVGIEKAQRVAPRLLGLVQGNVGLLE